jgi:hypothetical protein
MWDWYGNAVICYAYLSDVPDANGLKGENLAFRRSRWFTRGWTLQELISPATVCFYDASWGFLGKKGSSYGNVSFTAILSQITRIPSQVLTGPRELRLASVAQKMSWASHRTTTRTEDVAYSLLGIFGVNMAMLYGEGNRAFIRLQEEIMKSSNDESLFAWGLGKTPEQMFSILASSPAAFENCGDLLPSTPTEFKSSHYLLTNKGLHIEMSICNLPIGGGTSIGRLNCSSIKDIGTKSIAMPLICSRQDESTFFRAAGCEPVLVSSSLFPHSARDQVYLLRGLADGIHGFHCGFTVRFKFFGKSAEFKIEEIYPPAWCSIMSGGHMWNQRGYLNTQQQGILFLCENVHGRNFAVRIDYVFQFCRIFGTSNSSRIKVPRCFHRERRGFG